MLILCFNFRLFERRHDGRLVRTLLDDFAWGNATFTEPICIDNTNSTKTVGLCCDVSDGKLFGREPLPMEIGGNRYRSRRLHGQKSCRKNQTIARQKTLGGLNYAAADSGGTNYCVFLYRTSANAVILGFYGNDVSYPCDAPGGTRHIMH